MWNKIKDSEGQEFIGAYKDAIKHWSQGDNRLFSSSLRHNTLIDKYEIARRFLNTRNNGTNVSKKYMTFTTLNDEFIRIFGNDFSHANSMLFWKPIAFKFLDLRWFPVLSNGRLLNRTTAFQMIDLESRAPNSLIVTSIPSAVTVMATTGVRVSSHNQTGFVYSMRNIKVLAFDDRSKWKEFYQKVLSHAVAFFSANADRGLTGRRCEYMQQFKENSAYFDTIGYISIMMAVLQVQFVDGVFSTVTEKRRNVTSYAGHLFCFLLINEQRSSAPQVMNIPLEFPNYSKKFKNMRIRTEHHAYFKSIFGKEGFSKGPLILNGRDGLDFFAMYGFGQDRIQALVNQQNS